MPGGSKNSSENMYRVGDHVYFEMLATAPYQIRKLEELSQNPDGTVVARVSIYFRRQDLTTNLVQSLDKEQDLIDAELFGDDGTDGHSSAKSNGIDVNNVNGAQDSIKSKINLSQISPNMKEHLKLCEVFPSSRQEILHATHIRGKCQVIALAEDVETRHDFAEKENLFFFTRKYDPEKKTLKPPGEKIRVGSKWQADIPGLNAASDPKDNDQSENLRLYEVPIFLNNRLSESLIDDFLILAGAVGLYARAHDTVTVSRDPCLLTAASRSYRGITKDCALAILHQYDYDLTKATSALVAGGQPMLFRDELEDWSPLEAQEFARTLEKEGKCLADMKKNLFPWKEMSDIVAFYYFWKTTDRYAFTCQKQAINKTDTKLKQVFIPLYNRVNPSVLYRKSDATEKSCDGCSASTSPTWYAWGSTEDLWKLCRDCWFYWKKYGGLRDMQKTGSSVVDCSTKEQLPSESNGAANGLVVGKASGELRQVMTSDTNNSSNNNKNHSKINLDESGDKVAHVTTPSQPTESFPCLIDGCKLVFRTQSTRDRHMSMVHRVSPQEAEALLSSAQNSLTTAGNSVMSARSWAQHNHPAACSSAVPFCSCLFLVDRIGRLALLKSATLKKLGRCPTRFMDNISFNDISSKGLLLAQDPIVLEKTQHTISRLASQSILLVCDRLMLSKGMTPINEELIAALLKRSELSPSSVNSHNSVSHPSVTDSSKKRPFSHVSEKDNETVLDENYQKNGNNLGHEENTTFLSSTLSPPPAKRPALS